MKHTFARLATLCALTAGSLTGLTAFSSSVAGAAPSPVLYNSTVSPLPGNVQSEAFQATQTGQFGNAITLAFGPSALSNVVVTMSSWGCQTGHWSMDTCSTTSGATFSEPITLNLFALGTNGAVGAPIASDTQTFNIPFRPSADNVHCTGSQLGKWFDAASATCFNGLATNITFDLSSQHLTLPSSFIYGIQYNTSGYGPHPYGYTTACSSTPAGCGYDSLNVGLSSDGTDVSAGSDVFPGKLYQDTTTAANFCDNGANGVGTFRLDSPAPSDPNNCASSIGGWSISGSGAPYFIPAVQFNGPAPTTLVTQPAVLELIPGLSLLAGPTATLSGPSGPLANQTVTFTSPGGAVLCTAPTNANGVATCGTNQALQALLGLGYVAKYAGSGSYTPTSAKGSLIVLLGAVII